jgi:hypothetical protein
MHPFGPDYKFITVNYQVRANPMGNGRTGCQLAHRFTCVLHSCRTEPYREFAIFRHVVGCAITAPRKPARVAPSKRCSTSAAADLAFYSFLKCYEACLPAELGHPLFATGVVGRTSIAPILGGASTATSHFLYHEIALGGSDLEG